MNRTTPRFVDAKYQLVTGFAQLPKGTPLSESQKIFATTLIIDRTDGRIVDASFTFLMSLTEEFLRGIVIGKKLPDDWDQLQNQINEQYLVPTQGAVIQALRVAIERYTDI
ncbi:DUF3870 domain-containing protein [Brevibacillus porteri]|uniref:DUF3870 domain-containing protein n=1 Tax=Brevibacillus porteri TaxID=2126350 RepID=UPI0036366ACE